ncbi:hypothetical protein MMC30_007533 [Trapelia coarctata]|nr:hypothetical protein [Trapelia coarctata]
MAIADPPQKANLNGHAHAPPAPAELHVLVVGAGVTGLLVAHGLKKAGIKFSIFESEPSFSHYRPREWSMGIHWSLPLLEALLPDDLNDRLNEAQNDPFLEAPLQDELPLINGLTGKVMKALPIPRTIRVSRRKMRAFCTQGLDVQYGKELVEVSYGPDGAGVTATFKDGEKVSGTILVGADGPRSSVRGLLLGEEKAKATSLNVVHSNVAVTYHDAEKSKFVRTAHPVFSMVTHPECFCFLSIQDVPDPEKPENWQFQIVTSWLGEKDASLDNAGRLAQVKQKAAVLPEPFRSANLWIPDDTRITYDRIAYWIPIPWDNRDGRATLCGDAAHAMTPHRGQGLNHAICDATNFVRAIKKVRDGESTLQVAISAYDNEVVRRGADEVIASRQNAYMMLDYSQVMDSPIMTRSLEKGVVED